jgi:hypothetical protein
MEKWLWFCVELSGQTWIYGSLRCGFRILKLDQTLYPVKWSAPHRTYQCPVERVRAHWEHVRARRERVRARQKCICAHRQAVRAGRENPDHGEVSAPASHVSARRDTSPRPWIPVRAHKYGLALALN